jgi:hypothetical protein
MFGESKSEYVSRKINTFRKDYQRQHEAEDIPVDEDEFRYLSLDVKWDAEDSWERSHGEGSWL